MGRITVSHIYYGKKQMFETTNQLITGGLQPCFVSYLQNSLTQL